MNLRRRRVGDTTLGITLDETTTRDDIDALWQLFARPAQALPDVRAPSRRASTPMIPQALRRTSAFLTHPVFNTHHSETEMLRYIRSLSDKDLALDRTMIPLGSCTMKLNATSEMIPITWPEFAQHAPVRAAPTSWHGYARAERPAAAPGCARPPATPASACSPTPARRANTPACWSIKAWHDARGEGHRNVCLIPESAHGTNPASAQMVGMQVVVVKCDADGQRRPGRPAGQVRAAQRQAGRGDDHLPLAPTACSRRT